MKNVLSTNILAFAGVVPTTDEINNIEVGFLAPNCFGNLVEVKSITYRGVDINGAAYVGVKLDNGSHGSTITESYKAGVVSFGYMFKKQLHEQSVL